MSLRSQLDRIEAALGMHSCPKCRDRLDTVLIEVDRLGKTKDSPDCLPCPDCGWMPKVIRIVEEIVEATHTTTGGSPRLEE
jgi:hypothetical protein